MSIESTWLRCPNCFADLDPVDERVVGCANGHRFDLAKHGYVTLLPPKAPRTVGDDRTMLAARAQLLDGGAFAPIADAVIGLTATLASGADSVRPLRVADLGCGTGYYSARLHDGVPVEILLADRSSDAVRMALRAVPAATGVVLDIWRPLPIRNRAADVILDVFAPRNPSEFRRILRPDGRLLVVVPTTTHLRELREQGALLDIPAEKDAAVAEQLRSAGFENSESRRVEYRIEADAAQQAQLVGMGPSAHHTSALVSTVDDHRDVTVSVDVLAFALAVS